jgi:biopolymer transport protein ExbD
MRTTLRRRPGPQFNITPLIDVVMLLIIFFLVSSHFVRTENLEAVELPQATHSEEPPERVPHRLIVTITAEGMMHVGGRVVDVTEIERMLMAASDEGVAAIATAYDAASCRDERGLELQLLNRASRIRTRSLVNCTHGPA